MKKLEDILKQEILNELNAPDQNAKLKEKLGIESTKHVGNYNKKDSFFKRLTVPKKILIAAASFILLAVIGIVGTTSYSKYINIPTYEGMEVSAIVNSQKESRRNINSIGFNDVNTLLLNDNTSIKDVINESIQPVIPEGIAYYATKGETIDVTVKISNPKFFEILSFTLNGRLYQTYEFKEGSNSEQIIVAFTCQDSSGLQTITIDAIKYVDGSTIKDARFKADRTITIGVKYEEVPTVSNLSEIIETTYFGLSFVVTDVSNLVNINNGLMMYVFDGTSIINISKLQLGMNVFPFSNLHMGKTYEYAIVAVYDQLDGRGKCANILASNKFTTKEGIKYENIETSYDYIKINFEQLHKEELTIEKVVLLNSDEIIEPVKNSDNSYIFNNLLSNKEYTIETTYSYTIVENGKPVVINKTIETTVETDSRPIPTIEFVDVVPGKEDVTFNFNINDTLPTLGKITAIKLYKDGLLIRDNLSTTNFTINELLSNNTYEIEVEYQYDLKDGNPRQILTYRYEFTTLENATPKVELTSAIIFGDMLTVWFSVNDPDTTLGIIGFEVYNSSGEKVAYKDAPDYFNDLTCEGDVSFTGITNNDSYTIYAIYLYDLNDGNGTVTIDASSIGKDNSIGYNK